MIDWLTLRLYGTEANIEAGRVISVDADGCIEWQTPKRLAVKGSHEATVSLRAMPHDGTVEISGNPAKWFQGHNLFGSNDIGELARAFARSVMRAAGFQLPQQADDLIARGIVLVSRVDLTDSWDFGTRPRAVAAVRSISEFGHLKHRGRGSLLAEGTCYFGKGSRRLSAKAYAKGLELVKHALPDDIDNRAELFELAQGLVRFEFTLRAMWLKDRQLDVLQNWSKTGVAPAELHSELMAGLNLSDATMRDTKTLEGLSPRLQLAYDAWSSGADLRAILPARTFYRYRRQLLPLGIDLAIKRPRTESNVIPLRVVLTGKPLEVPSWAKGTPLYFEPRAAA